MKNNIEKIKECEDAIQTQLNVLTKMWERYRLSNEDDLDMARRANELSAQAEMIWQYGEDLAKEWAGTDSFWIR